MQPEGIVRAEPTHGDAVQRENCIAHARYVRNVEREQQNATKPNDRQKNHQSQDNLRLFVHFLVAPREAPPLPS